MLTYIDKHSVDEKHLKDKFGDTFRLRLEELERNSAINYVFESDGITHVIVPSLEGRFILENYKANRSLTKKERWKERLWGFISGVLVTVIGELILRLLSR